MAPISIAALYDSKSKTINVSLICDTLEMPKISGFLHVEMRHYLWSDLYVTAFTSWAVTLVS